MVRNRRTSGQTDAIPVEQRRVPFGESLQGDRSHTGADDRPVSRGGLGYDGAA
jgi:hypothetical protein